MDATSLDTITTGGVSPLHRSNAVAASCDRLWSPVGPFRLTSHARKRAQQRGITLGTIETVAMLGDRRMRVPGGKIALWISDRAQKQLINAGMPPAVLQRANNIRLIADPSTYTILTVEHSYRRRFRR